MNFEVKTVRKYLFVVFFTTVFQLNNSAVAVELGKHPELIAVAATLIAKHGFSRAELDAIFAKATIQQSVLDAMKSPAEYKFTWGKYRKLFMKPERITQGVEFWQQYEADLTRASETYGVPAEVIVAIIGVESKFGKYKGKHKVLDSLVTLVTGYPRRSKFFSDELVHFLILTKENQLESDVILGSYAGAVGFPQFISSSYRNYAVDFSGDGKTDLIGQPVDAIGSVANYFVKNGWSQGETVVTKADGVIANELVALANRKLKTQYSATKLRSLGANLPMNIAGDERLNVLMMDASEIVDDVKKSGIHTVRAGDTACQIAEKYKVRCKALFKANSLKTSGAIYRGQRLKIPGKGNARGDVTMREPMFFYTHKNFYAITRYNHSVLYAMAVHELSQAIAKEKSGSRR